MVRGGYGIYYNNIQTLLNFPENRNISQCNVLIVNPSYPDPYGGKSPTSFCSSAAPTVTVLDQNFSMPYSQQFTLGYSREIVHDFSIHVDGVYMHTLKDWRTVDVNYSERGRCAAPAGLRAHSRSRIDFAVQVPRHVRARGEALRQALPVPGVLHAGLQPRR